jgi:predicted metal-binding membrane protein
VTAAILPLAAVARLVVSAGVGTPRRPARRAPPAWLPRVVTVMMAAMTLPFVAPRGAMYAGDRTSILTGRRWRVGGPVAPSAGLGGFGLPAFAVADLAGRLPSGSRAY